VSGARPDTWMPWYIGDYLRKTMSLDAEKDGAYRRLIDATWVAGGLLKASDEEFAAITKLPLKRWKAIKPRITEFFQVSADGWRHERVSEELAKAQAFFNARSAGGKRAAEKRWSDTLNGNSRIADASLSDAPSPSPSHEDASNKKNGSNRYGVRGRMASLSATDGLDDDAPFDEAGHG
jgi:uncharacterized protein YdaU (DUF1376 family)